jgi:hypothetical protein
MCAAFGLDALFSRKGEAAPAVQAAIPLTRPNRFEALARTLGRQDDGELEQVADDEVSDDVDDWEPEDDNPVADANAAQAAAAFPRPHIVWDGDAPGDQGAAEADVGDDDGVEDNSEGDDGSALLDGGMVTRSAPQAEVGRDRPWQRVRGSADETAAPQRTAKPEYAPAIREGLPPWISLKSGHAAREGEEVGLSFPEDTGDLEVFLFGVDEGEEFDPQAAGFGRDRSGRPRRRHVSVRLPAREHALLRQFAKVCGTTQQSVVRRAVLGHMIEELKRRLEDGGAHAPDARAAGEDSA